MEIHRPEEELIQEMLTKLQSLNKQMEVILYAYQCGQMGRIESLVREIRGI